LLKIIESNNIDRKKWNLLAEQSKVSFQNFSLFLDTLSENWCAIILDNYRGGIAIPYTVRLGIKGVFSPPLTSPLSWLGEKPDNFAEINLMLRNYFKRAYFTSYEQLLPDGEKRIYQRIKYQNDYEVSYSTRRNLSKFKRKNLTIQEIEVSQSLSFVFSTLGNKVDVGSQKFTRQLTSFFRSYPQCYCYGIKNETQDILHACVILVESSTEITSLYCASDTFGKKNKMMYALIHRGIQLSISKKKDFNFGGSSIESIRAFNLRFGSEDNFYYCWKWENSPWWFRFILKLRNLKQVLNKKHLFS